MYQNLTYNQSLSAGSLDDTPNIFIDTSVLIDASKSEDFLKFLVDKFCSKATMIITPSVEYEFTRGAKTLSELDSYIQIIQNLNIVKMQDLEKKSQAKNHESFLLLLIAAQWAIDAKGDQATPIHSYAYSETLTLGSFRPTIVIFRLDYLLGSILFV